MKTHGGIDVYPHTFLTSVPDGVSSNFIPQRFTPRKDLIPTRQKAGWDPKLLQMLQRREKCLTPLSGTEP
jgi:hypothetical protein